MTTIGYLDCSSGISGDMFLAALIGAGLAKERLLTELQKIPLGRYEFNVSQVLRGGLTATRVEIDAPGDQPHRHLGEIERMLEASVLSENAKARALAIFRRLAKVEGKLHGKPPESVHFHEVGAVDAVLDIAGACAGLELLEIADVSCSPLNVGGGRIEAVHGKLPVPAPATAELLKGLPVYSTGIEAELVTPTGAAIVSTLASGFGPMPAFKIQSIGYGAGARDFQGHPNVARLFVGEKSEHPDSSADVASEVVSVIQANLDDMNPQIYGYLVEQALSAGALDITCAPVQMKKNRPGCEVTVVCHPQKAGALSHLLFEQTTTLGLRIYEARRDVLGRETVSVETAYGNVRVKVAQRGGAVMNVAPEYEDCQRLAREKSVPLKEIMLAAQIAFRQRGL